MTSYVVEQKITAFANQYRIFSVNPDETRGDLVAFAHQKRLAFKEKIEFFSDEKRTKLAFTVKAEKVMDIHGKFLVLDVAEQHIGSVKKVFGASLLRSTWEIYSKTDAVIANVTERSMGMAVFRRAWGFVPYIGDLPFFFKYHFDFVASVSGEHVGSYSKTTLLRDHYRLEVEDSLTESVGWETLVAQAVLLDALQGR